jgi:hypothetical protein
VAPTVGPLTTRSVQGGSRPLHGLDDGARPSACGRGVQKNGGQAAQALGRSRGGFSTNIHAGSLDETTGVSFVLTGGQRHDAPGFDAVCAQLPQEQALEQAIMDRGDDRNHMRHSLQAQGMTPVIPPKKNRKEPLHYAAAPYT